MKPTTVLLLSLLFVVTLSTAFAAKSDTSSQDNRRVMRQFVHVLATQWGIDQERISAETLFLQEFGADSVDLMELVMALEDFFDIVISDDDWGRVTTVDSAVSLIAEIRSRPVRLF